MDYTIAFYGRDRKRPQRQEFYYREVFVATGLNDARAQLHERYQDVRDVHVLGARRADAPQES